MGLHYDELVKMNKNLIENLTEYKRAYQNNVQNNLTMIRLQLMFIRKQFNKTPLSELDVWNFTFTMFNFLHLMEAMIRDIENSIENDPLDGN